LAKSLANAQTDKASRRSIRAAESHATTGRGAATLEDAYFVILQAMHFVVIERH
jgi:hypothetical protein